MEGVQRLAGGLAAATVINALMPNYALSQQVSRTDDPKPSMIGPATDAGVDT
jgi:hypothetical protein